MRPGGEFFATPGDATQRRYEGLQAYFLEELSAAEAAGRVGWATATITCLLMLGIGLLISWQGARGLRRTRERQAKHS